MQTLDALRTLGFKPVHHQHWLSLEPQKHPWRVHAVDRGLCRLVSTQPDPVASDTSTLTPTVQSFGEDCETRDALPPKADSVAVGDWVLLNDDAAQLPRVEHILTRSTTLQRGAVAGQSKHQLIACNLDTVFVVCAFAPTAKLQSRALNPRRIERYVSLIASGGATPVVVLNKADLASDPATAASELSSRLGHVEVQPVSATDGDGVSRLVPHLAPGDSVALVGPSGVGKSTLINRLLGHAAQDTGNVRATDTKGKHTTTRRQMLLMTGGAWLIDTPGMRELGVGEDVADGGFDDITELAAQCRFTDCSHQREPGCAVRRAIADGVLDRDRLENQQAIARESLRFAARHDAYARHLQHKHFRQLNKQYRAHAKKH